MQLHVINSNSIGNSYILESSTGEALLIECGVSFDKILKALNFQTTRVAGCIITHEHKDHCKSVMDVIAKGINVYATQGTHDAMGTAKSHRAIITFDQDTFNVGSFRIKAFEAKHDCAEPVGYLIYHAECGTVLFLTDSYYTEHNWSSIPFNNIIIEANYCQTILDRKLSEGSTIKVLRDRVIESHMSLATCIKTLQANDMRAVRNIVLIHLSDSNSHAERFKNEVAAATGKVVWIAEPGLSIPFNKNPF
jgi:phosphoribosyl 1,2-cyclic phosphodiesterase